MGGIQSLSRSTYSKFLPQTEDHASFFSFYDVMEKLGMIIGTVIFSIIGEIVHGMRPSILSLIIYFIAGFLLLMSLRKKIAWVIRKNYKGENTSGIFQSLIFSGLWAARVRIYH